jgi:hypothetical protein
MVKGDMISRRFRPSLRLDEVDLSTMMMDFRVLSSDMVPIVYQCYLESSQAMRRMSSS